jgi:hypothetical protein
MYQSRTITVQEKRPARNKKHAYDEDYFAKKAARFWNVFKVWGLNKWIVEPDEDKEGIWVVWDENENELATGNSPIQALESAIKRTRKSSENTRAANGKRNENNNRV